MSSIFDLPSDAIPGPNVINARFERINSTTDIKRVIGSTHNFRLEPSGTDWWLPNKSYFRTKLKIVVGFNETRYAPFKPYSTVPDAESPSAQTDIKTVKQRTNWPLPSRSSDVFMDSGDYVGYARDNAGYKFDKDSTIDVTTGSVANPTHDFTTGLKGISLMKPVFVKASTFLLAAADDNVPGTLSVNKLQNPDFNAFTRRSGISYIGNFKPFTCLKFLELADCACDAFFDQMSFSIGPVRIESVTHPQLISTMRKRATQSPLVGGTRFDSMGVFSDEQHSATRDRNVSNGKTTVFDILGYDNIQITTGMDWETEYTVEFDVLYVPPLSIFEQPHAMPPARYDIEFKGTSADSQAQNNFFHCTLPGSTGRWHMEYGTSTAPGVLNQQGPATKLDGKHGVGRSSARPSQHSFASIFLYEPPVGAGPNLNPVSIENHFLGRNMSTTPRFNSTNSNIARSDPGCFVSVQIVSMHLEAAMVTGPIQNDSAFVLQFDQLSAQLLPMSVSNTQHLIFDVDPFANFFMFGFRQTDTNRDVCLQEGHLICPANTERDLKEYHINFDMKTRPVNFATEINLYNIRGATNELIRTQMNCMTLYSAIPETIRTWLKKGPYYAYDWPRDGTANATRFQLNLTFHDKTTKHLTGTMGPNGQFENEMPLVYSQASVGFQNVSPNIDDDDDWNSVNEYAAVMSDQRYLSKGSFAVTSPKMNNDPANKYFLACTIPSTFWSLYYPCSQVLLASQNRIDAMDFALASDIVSDDYANSPDDATANGASLYNLYNTIGLNLSMTQVIAGTFSSASELDQGYKGTEHSRPQDLHLSSPNNSVILFQNIPRKFVIETSSGRVIGVRTIDNRT